jgi:hypothetical protein
MENKNDSVFNNAQPINGVINEDISNDDDKSLLTNFNIIIKNFTLCDQYLENIDSDIKNLSLFHKKITANLNTKKMFHYYGIYCDDIYFQKKILIKECNLLKEVMELMKRKMYGDLFRLYVKIVKLIIALHVEYSDIKREDTNNLTLSNYISDACIKTYDEINEIDKYNCKDISNIFNNVVKKINEIKQLILQVGKLIETNDSKIKYGYSIELMIISLVGEKNKIAMDYDLLRRLLFGMIEINLKMSEKYLIRAKNLSGEINDN